MKKLLCCLLLCCLGLSLFACGPKEAAFTPPPAEDMVAALAESALFTEELTSLSSAQVARYLDLDEADFADAAMSMDASRTTPEFILVLTAKDEQGRDAQHDAMMAYLHNTLEEYRDYRPEEVPKLEVAVVKWKGMQNVMVVSADEPTAVEQAIDAAWAGK